MRAVARFVVKDHGKRRAAQAWAYRTDSLSDPDVAEAVDVRAAYRMEPALEAALWAYQTRVRLQQSARRGTAARAGRLFALRLAGYTPAEIGEDPEIALGERAVPKAIAAQDAQIRRWAGRDQKSAKA